MNHFLTFFLLYILYPFIFNSILLLFFSTNLSPNILHSSSSSLYSLYDCSIKGLEKWNISNGNDFSDMFNGCSSLSDIKSLEKWNVSNGNNFSCMFRQCSSLYDIKPLEKWNVSNGNNFSGMLGKCSSLSDIKPLQNWNVSNKNYLHYIKLTLLYIKIYIYI